MSARYLQKPKQVNFKDGTLGTALLVTLAFGPPTSQALFSGSDIPPTSDTSPPPESTAEAGAAAADSGDLLNSSDIFSRGEVPTTPQAKQQWISLRMNLCLQIIQGGYVEKNGFTLMEKAVGELYTRAELIGCKNLDLLKESPYSSPTWEQVLVDTVDELVAALDEGDKSRWTAYEKKHEVDITLPGPHGHLHEYFHAAQWLFAQTSPEFSAAHHKHFALLSKALVSWAGMFLEDITKVQLPSAWFLVADVAESGVLTTNAFKMFKSVDNFLVNRHYAKPVSRWRL
eukprot:Blabericola_migrator_1__2640@NODE_1748_length_3865_cov_143_336756_g1126_i0_p1_GENE_NODE_1748_length_3865_cov_143_336756_g1126_i0NODE_1748_length_3865_cov_143_336756_g1126_i0_p1_ORF_typecomplete_len286_score34_66_NODE_1748_length_3865_cov_143_336756_g1126_i029233780